MERSQSGRRSAAIRAAIVGADPKRTYKEVAALAGISYPVLTHMAAGRTVVTNEALEAIRRALALPDSWPDGLTEGARRASNTVDTYMYIYRGVDRIPLIHPGDSLEIQPAALPRIGALNLMRTGTQETLASLDIEDGELRADRDVDIEQAAAVGYVIAVFGEDGFAFTAERGVGKADLANAIRRRA